jgi:hypothetical protein
MTLPVGPWSQRRAEVIGQRSVWMFDISRAVHIPSSSSSGGGGGGGVIAGVSVSRFSNGDSMDLSSFRIAPAGSAKH